MWPASTPTSRPWQPHDGLALDPMSPQAEPALRADAERNRRRILEAAAAAFSEGGLDVGVAEIARRAGVGAGTLFRRFPTKEDLVFAIIEERMLELIAAGRDALEEDDPEQALRSFMLAGAEMHVQDKGFFDAVQSRINKGERLGDLRDEIVGLASELLTRAQGAGAVRDDVEPQELPLLMCAAASAAAPVHGAVPGLWRRYVALILDGLKPCASSTLAPAAPSVEDFEAAMSQLGGERADGERAASSRVRG